MHKIQYSHYYCAIVCVLQYVQLNDLSLSCTRDCGKVKAGERAVVPKVELGEQRVNQLSRK